MKIVILFGSPNSHGSTRLLVDGFIKGSHEHEIELIDVTKLNIHPCTGCLFCGYEGPCIQEDDMLEVKEKIMNSDMIVFATPLYYYGMSAQLKTVIDRFCSFNFSLTDKRMKSALLTVAWNQNDWTFDALVSHYQTLVKYLHFEDMGMVLGYGCGSVSQTQSSKYVQEARYLGGKL